MIHEISKDVFLKVSVITILLFLTYLAKMPETHYPKILLVSAGLSTQ